MIKYILLPEKIGSFYLFPKTIVGIAINKTHISATKVRLSGSTITFEQHIEHVLEHSNNDLQERIAQGLRSIIDQVGHYDELRTVLASTLVVYKELSFPFLNRRKIAMVLPFEIEPLLPFASNQAAIDFIITKQYQKEKRSEILAAAVPQDQVTSHIEYFKYAQLNPNIITIDLFALYALYQCIPEYTVAHESIILLDIDYHTMRIAYIYNGQLKHIRSFPQGITTLAKAMGDQLKIPVQHALDQFIRFGLEQENPSAQQVVQKLIRDVYHNIELTITSFSQLTTQENSPLKKILLIGPGALLKGLTQYITEQSQLPCELLQLHSITQNKHIRIAHGVNLPLSGIMSIACAFPTDITQDFNLNKEYILSKERSLLVKQIITSIFFTISCLSILSVFIFFNIRLLKKELRLSEQESVEELKVRFRGIAEDETDLEEVLNLAKEELTKEKTTWFAFSSSARSSFLQYLLELTSKIDKESLEFTIEKIHMDQDVLTLKAQVRDHEALKILERELQESTLFSGIEPQDNPSFTMKIFLTQKIEDQ